MLLKIKNQTIISLLIFIRSVIKKHKKRKTNLTRILSLKNCFAAVKINPSHVIFRNPTKLNYDVCWTYGVERTVLNVRYVERTVLNVRYTCWTYGMVFSYALQLKWCLKLFMCTYLLYMISLVERYLGYYCLNCSNRSPTTAILSFTKNWKRNNGKLFSPLIAILE